MTPKTYLKKIQVTILAILTISFMASASWATTYYVDAGSGSDSNSGTTQTQPWRTISKVNGQSFNPGDNIFFKRGETWNETLKPDSGSSSATVNYGVYGNGDKPVISNFSASDKSYIKVQDIEFTTNSSSYAVHLNNSHHITVQNCDLYASTSSDAYAVLRIEMNSNYNKIMNCSIEHKRTDKQNDTVNIYLNASYNLLEGNTIKGSTHTVLGMMGASDRYPSYENKYNIIRNNIIENSQARPLSINTNSNYNLIENNTIMGGKDTTYCSGGQTFKMVTSNNIIRNNIIRDSNSNSGGGLAIYVYQYSDYPPNNASDNRIYNNVFTGLAKYAIVLGTYAPDLCRLEDNVFKNNIIYNNGGYQVTVKDYSSIRNNYFHNNLIYKSGETDVMSIKDNSYSVAESESADPTLYSGNVQKDPALDSNYRPLSGSPAINAGAHLTNVVSTTGSGTTFKVSDATYFSDGFGVITGDSIVIGDSTATITSIDYDNNIITVNKNISWETGDGVSFPYSGTAMDIGSYESSSESNSEISLMPPTGLTVISSN